LTAIEQNIDEFRRKHIAVMVISFGVEKGAKIWLDETKCTFPMLLDQERTLYASFGLQRSIEKVFQVNVMKYYAEQTLQHPLPKSQEGIEDDVLQMGGDFTIHAKDAVLSFSYPSKTPSDRPSMESIFQKIST